jgi:hypothetical protein
MSRFVQRPVVSRLRTSVSKSPVRIPAYYNFATAFVALQERIAAETSISVTVKEIDYLLLS